MQTALILTNTDRSSSRVPSRYDGYFKNIQGQSFGSLIAVHPTDKRDRKGSVIWACLCACKTVAYVSADNLISGNTKSCGCLKEAISGGIHERLHFIDGTCVEWIEKRKHRSDNTSGFRGVYKMREDRYRVSIGFKGMRHHLGYYKTFDDAVQARLDAEDELFAPFLAAYRAVVAD